MNILTDAIITMLEEMKKTYEPAIIGASYYVGGCGCSGNCGQSCAGGCDSGCSGDCGRSCSGGCS